VLLAGHGSRLRQVVQDLSSSTAQDQEHISGAPGKMANVPRVYRK